MSIINRMLRPLRGRAQMHDAVRGYRFAQPPDKGCDPSRGRIANVLAFLRPGTRQAALRQAEPAEPDLQRIRLQRQPCRPVCPLLVLFLAPFAQAWAADAAAAPPNVVFFLADDLGYSDLGCYGGEIRT